MADVLVRVYEQALAGQWVSPPRDWWRKLYWMARSQVSKNRNRAMRAIPTASRAETRMKLEEVPAAEDEVVGGHDFQVILARACKRLTPRERAVLLARVQGFSHKEIAEILGTTPPAARVHYSNACSKLAQDEEGRNAA